MKTIIDTVQIHEPPSDVLQALTTKEGVTGWWTTKAGLEETEGGAIDFTV